MQIQDCQVVGHREADRDGYSAVIIGHEVRRRSLLRCSSGLCAPPVNHLHAPSVIGEEIHDLGLHLPHLLSPPRGFTLVAHQNVLERRIKSAVRGQYRKLGLPCKRHRVEFRVTPDAMLPIGLEVNCEHFTLGQFVDVQGIT